MQRAGIARYRFLAIFSSRSKEARSWAVIAISLSLDRLIFLVGGLGIHRVRRSNLFWGLSIDLSKVRISFGPGNRIHLDGARV